MKLIENKCKHERISNIEVITADMNDFTIRDKFDRVISIEMFEHMRNYYKLLEKIDSFLKPSGKLFVHIFTHKEMVYPFEDGGDGDNCNGTGGTDGNGGGDANNCGCGAGGGGGFYSNGSNGGCYGYQHGYGFLQGGAGGSSASGGATGGFGGGAGTHNNNTGGGAGLGNLDLVVDIVQSGQHQVVKGPPPPCSKNSSLDSLPISSIVSRQSDEKPGQKTWIFWIPSFGNSSSLDDK